MISILDKRQQPTTRVSFVFWRHPLFSLGLACHFPGLDSVPRWGSSISHPWLSEVLVWQVIFCFFSNCLFRIFSAVQGLSFFLWPSESCQRLCWLLYLPPSLHFLLTHAFSLIFVPFHIPSSVFFFFSSVLVLYPVLFSPFWHLTSVHCLTLPSSLTFFLHAVPLVIVLLHPFSWLMVTYIYVCTHISLLHSRSSILQLKQRNDLCW